MGCASTGIGQSEDEPRRAQPLIRRTSGARRRAPDGAPCTTSSAPTTLACVREVVRISGSYTLVQGLTLQNGLAYHAEITGGMHHVFSLQPRCARPWRSRCASDQLKLDGNAQRHPGVATTTSASFRSQAIDMAQVFDVLVEDNEFTIRSTTMPGRPAPSSVRAQRDDPAAIVSTISARAAPTLAFSLGGTGSPHSDDQTRHIRVHVESNRIWNVAGQAGSNRLVRGLLVRAQRRLGRGRGRAALGVGDGDPMHDVHEWLRPEQRLAHRGQSHARAERGRRPGPVDVSVSVAAIATQET